MSCYRTAAFVLACAVLVALKDNVVVSQTDDGHQIVDVPIWLTDINSAEAVVTGTNGKWEIHTMGVIGLNHPTNPPSLCQSTIVEQLNCLINNMIAIIVEAVNTITAILPSGYLVDGLNLNNIASCDISLQNDADYNLFIGGWKNSFGGGPYPAINVLTGVGIRDNALVQASCVVAVPINYVGQGYANITGKPTHEEL